MILNQTNLIPQAIITNGFITANPVQNPNNLLNTTDSTAIFGATSDVLLGNYPFNIPVGAVIVGISGIMKARIQNSSVPFGAITPILVDPTTGQQFPGAPVTGLSDVLQEYAFGGAYDVWSNLSWTPVKINNLQLDLGANQAIEVAWATLTVFYFIPAVVPVLPPFTLPGCADCDSEVQALPFKLKRVWRTNETKLLLESFNTGADDPITLAMIGACGGSINITIDPDKSREDGGDFIENFNLDASVAAINIVAEGIELDIGNLNERGLGFSTPYGHDPANISEHAVGAILIITNNGPYNSKLLKRCMVGTVVSAPINVLDEGVTTVVSIEDLNFIGDDVQAEQDSINPRQANVTIIGSPTNTTPSVENTNTGTTNTTQALTLTVALTVTSANYLRVAVITEDETITGVTYNGVPMTLIGQKSNPGSNLKVALFGLINPAVGTHNAVVTMPTPRIITAIVTGWLDVDVTSPVDGVSAGNIGSDNAPTDSATTSTQNTVMQDVVGTTNNPTTFSQFGLWSIQGNVTSGNRPGASASRRVLAPQNVVDTYSISVSTGWAILLAGIRGISNPSTSDEKVKVTSNDTTPGFLKDKISMTSLDGSVVITPSVVNPGANEVRNFDLSAPGGGTAGSIQSPTILQVAHGLSIGDVIKSNGTADQYAVADRSTVVNAEVVGLVVSVPDADHFIYTKDIIGFTDASVPAGTPGAAVFLGTAGAMSLTPPSVNSGLVNKPIGVLTGVNEMNFSSDYRGDLEFNTPPVSPSLILPGQEVKLNQGGYFATALIPFQGFLVENGFSGNGGLLVFEKDVNTGAMRPSAISLLGDSLSISEDGQSLYTLSVSTTGGNPTVGTVTLRQYDNALSLVQTSTYVSGNVWTRGSCIQGATGAQKDAFFVKAGHLVTLCYGQAANGGADAFASDFTISGASLTSRVDTNITIHTNIGPTNAVFNYATVFNNVVYIQDTGFQGSGTGYIGTYPNGHVQTFTYAAATLSALIATHNFVIPTVTSSGGINYAIGGFVPLGVTIGEWTNSTIRASAPTDIQYLSAIYNEYTF